MTPNDLEILIHCHVCALVHPRYNAPAVREAIDGFLEDGIIEPSNQYIQSNCFTTTTKGQIWLEMILETPHPDLKWAEPRK